MKTNRMSSIRKEKGYTQQDMADMLKIGIQQYSRIERGESEGSNKVLEQIAEILDTTVDYLKNRQSYYEHEILKLLKKFSEEQQKSALQIMQNVSHIIDIK